MGNVFRLIMNGWSFNQKVIEFLVEMQNHTQCLRIVFHLYLHSNWWLVLRRVKNPTCVATICVIGEVTCIDAWVKSWHSGQIVPMQHKSNMFLKEIFLSVCLCYIAVPYELCDIQTSTHDKHVESYIHDIGNPKYIFIQIDKLTCCCCCFNPRPPKSSEGISLFQQIIFW